MTRKTAIILGIHSFLDYSSKKGIQHIAEGLAENGWDVDYVSIVSSPFDIYGPARRKRLVRVWLNKQDQKGIPIRPGLTEYAFRSLFPAHKVLFRFPWQLKAFTRLAPAWLSKKHYSVCIYDVTPNQLFLQLISAKVMVHRINDLPSGFAHDLHPVLVDWFNQQIASFHNSEIWAVSNPLAEFARKLNNKVSIHLLPNGVEDFFGSAAQGVDRQKKSAVFLGSSSAWVDFDLIEQTAALLPDWTFHLYGACDRERKGKNSNVYYYPGVARKKAAGLLAGFEVGLIPYKDISGRMRSIERPLKFYEYMAAGLGIASTDTGALKAGMGELACYGNTPAGFARAITRASRETSRRTPAFCQDFIMRHSWSRVAREAIDRLERLLTSHGQASC